MNLDSAERPFRHLCPEADRRDAMNDSDFWAHVLGVEDDANDYDAPDIDVQVAPGICAVCGGIGACGWDAEGRPLIHADDTPSEHGGDDAA